MSWLPALDTAMALRVPIFTSDVGPKQRIDSLGDYMLLTAYWAAELNESRMGLYEEIKGWEAEWDDLEGWEPFQRGRTDGSVNAAKAQLKPELWKQLKDARWKVARLTDEIDRLERDAAKASRYYTLLSGS